MMQKLTPPTSRDLEAALAQARADLSAREEAVEQAARRRADLEEKRKAQLMAAANGDHEAERQLKGLRSEISTAAQTLEDARALVEATAHLVRNLEATAETEEKRIKLERFREAGERAVALCRRFDEHLAVLRADYLAVENAGREAYGLGAAVGLNNRKILLTQAMAGAAEWALGIGRPHDAYRHQSLAAFAAHVFATVTPSDGQEPATEEPEG